MIGLSLSCCVPQIVAGIVKVEDVDFLVVGTSAQNADDWNEVFKRYRTAYWIPSKNDPKNYTDQCEGVARLLVALNKVRQPKLTENRYPLVNADGSWWVNSLDEIRYRRWNSNLPVVGSVEGDDDEEI
jgi:hypothetical protein